MFDYPLHKHFYFDRLRNRKLRIFLQTGVLSCIAVTSMLFDMGELRAQQGEQCYVPLPALQLENGEDEFGIVDEMVSSGQSVFQFSEYVIGADQITFRDEQNVTEVTGNIVFISEDQQISADSAVIAADEEATTIVGAEFELFVKDKNDPSVRYQRGRGSAEGIKLENNTLHLESADFTLCPEGNNEVEFATSKLTVNSDSKQAVARNVVVRYKGKPVLYTPYLRLPIGNERLSGFLFPTVSTSSKHGFGLAVPYYFNLAPNRDATLTPTYFSKRGLHLQGEYRYLGANSDMTFVGEFMPRDEEFTDRGNRYGAEMVGKWHDGGSLYSSFDISWISDESYLDDYSGQFSTQVKDFLQQSMSFSYANHGLVVSTGVSKFFVSDTDVSESSEPYNRVPWIAVDYIQPLMASSAFSTSIALDKFKHVDRPGGRRLRAETKFNTLFDHTFSELDLEVGGEYLEYKLSAPDPDRNQSEVMSVDSVYASLDGKLFFDRFSGDESGTRWTLVPRIKVLATDSVEQSNLPNFDTSMAVLDNYDRLFSGSPYIGGDRLRGSNQVGVGLSANYHDPTNSSVSTSVGIGRIFYPDGHSGSLEDDPGEPSNKSDLFFETRIENSATKFHYSSLFSDKTNKISSSSLRVTHALSENTEIMSVFRHFRDDKSVWGTAVGFKPDSDWSFKVHAIKSFDPDQMEEVRLSFNHQSCCSLIDVALERERQADGSYDNSIFVTFDLTPRLDVE